MINPRANGSTLYLHGLKQYLSHFAGRPAVFVTAQAPEHANTHQAWSKFEEALGLPDGTPALTVGDEIRLTPIGLPAIESVVDYVEPGEDFLALRSTNGLYRFHSLERLGMSIAIGHYIYLNNDETVSDRDRHDLEQQWQSWVDGISERAK